MIKNNRGISLTATVITVLLILILLSTLVFSTTNNIDARKLNKIYVDLRSISDAVNIYYLKNNKLPIDESKTEYVAFKGSLVDNDIKFVVKNRSVRISGEEDFVNPNDYDKKLEKAEYQVLDLGLLDNISLNNTDLTYIINKQSHTIYVLEGVKVDNTYYYYLPIKYKDIDFNDYNVVNSIKLKNGATAVYLSMDGSKVNLKDKIQFNHEENDGLGTPKDVEFYAQLGAFFDVDIKNGIICKNENENPTAIVNVPQICSVVVSNYGQNDNVKLDIPIKLTYIDVEDENNNKITSVNMTRFSTVTYNVKKYGFASDYISVTSNNTSVATATYNQADSKVSINATGKGNTTIVIKEERPDSLAAREQGGNSVYVINVNVN